MHSYQPSRGRIFFQVLCAFGISAALADAWLQTGVRGLAAAGLVTALYGLVHFFDLFRRSPAVEAEPQRIDFDTPIEAEPEPVLQSFDPQPLPAEPQFVVADAVEEEPQYVANVVEFVTDDPAVDEMEAVEPVPTPAKASRRPKAPRKGGNRRGSKSLDEETRDLEPADEVEAEASAHSDDNLPEMIPEPPEAPLHSPVAPLFEPEPFGRQPHRATFGRKVG